MSEWLVPIPEVSLFDYLRMMSHVIKTDTCWLWQASTKNGYGQIGIMKRMYYTHRVAWRWHKKNDPGKLLVLHTCNTRNCVNPDHLFLGTQFVNMEQMHREGRRNQKGELHPRAKLRDSDVVEIRRRYDDGEKLVEIAKSFSWVAERVVRYAAQRETWQHVH